MKIDQNLLTSVIRPRPTDSHKGSFGRVLLIGGFYPYGGAIIMAALACVNSGAGLTTVATTKDNITALHSHLPEAMAMDVADFELLQEQISVADVILIGPGLSETTLAKEVFDLVLSRVTASQTLIIDGSALNLLAKNREALKSDLQVILTPHQKEWERLSGLAISQQSVKASQEALALFPEKTVLVAKSAHTSIVTKTNHYDLAVGGPYQATGGTGDTLAGMIAGFVAQFDTPLLDTIAVATHCHSAIAEQLSKTHYVVLPTMISAEISRFMADVVRSANE